MKAFQFPVMFNCVIGHLQLIKLQKLKQLQKSKLKYSQQNGSFVGQNYNSNIYGEKNLDNNNNLLSDEHNRQHSSIYSNNNSMYSSNLNNKFKQFNKQYIFGHHKLVKISGQSHTNSKQENKSRQQPQRNSDKSKKTQNQSIKSNNISRNNKSTKNIRIKKVTINNQTQQISLKRIITKTKTVNFTQSHLQEQYQYQEQQFCNKNKQNCSIRNLSSRTNLSKKSFRTKTQLDQKPPFKFNGNNNKSKINLLQRNNYQSNYINDPKNMNYNNKNNNKIKLNKISQIQKKNNKKVTYSNKNKSNTSLKNQSKLFNKSTNNNDEYDEDIKNYKRSKNKKKTKFFNNSNSSQQDQQKSQLISNNQVKSYKKHPKSFKLIYKKYEQIQRIKSMIFITSQEIIGEKIQSQKLIKVTWSQRSIKLKQQKLHHNKKKTIRLHDINFKKDKSLQYSNNHRILSRRRNQQQQQYSQKSMHLNQPCIYSKTQLQTCISPGPANQPDQFNIFSKLNQFHKFIHSNQIQQFVTLQQTISDGLEKQKNLKLNYQIDNKKDQKNYQNRMKKFIEEVGVIEFGGKVVKKANQLKQITVK